jgi:D-alanyl-lipoteichoic acid acyltransferase DltB (MBOAT superfamily)
MASLGLDWGLAAIVASALAAYYLPFLRRPTGYLVLTIMVAIAVYREAILGYVLCIVALFVFTRLVERLTGEGGQSRISRWSYACAAMFAALALFLIQSWHLLDRAQVRVASVTFVAPQHDMWLLVRVVSFLWEFGSARLPMPTLSAYLVWILLPFTTRGPFLRYSEFRPQYLQVERPARQLPPMEAIWWRRLALAAVQIAAGGACAWLSAEISGLPHRWPKAFIVFGTGPWSFYLLTGGTYHLMECMSALWDVELPLSFNYPFGQPNLSEFWARWNMTITRVCRDYLFYNRWGLRTINVYLNLMILFLAIGLWHGANYYWTTWGLMHGVGFCVYMYWRNHRERLAELGARIPSPIRDAGARALTYAFVCLAWYLATKIALALLRAQSPNGLY